MNEIYEIADQQGWNNESLGQIALDFIATNENLRISFVAFLRQAQDLENDGLPLDG